MKKNKIRLMVLAVLAAVMAFLLSGCTNNTKMGYIDKEGNTVVPGVFQMVQPFHEGVAGAMLGQEEQTYWGFVDAESMAKIGMTLDAVRPFYDGVAPVKQKNDPYWIYIDKTGNQAIEGQFADASVFVHGLAPVKGIDSEKYGFIDREGKEVIAQQFDTASIFSETDKLAMIREGGEALGRCGYIDMEGNVVIEPTYFYGGTFNEGFAVVKLSSDMNVADWGMINTSGEIAMGGDFVECGNFAEGVFPAAVNKDGKTLWGFMDGQGNWKIEPKFTSALSFSEGLAGAQSAENSLWGYIDITGEWVLEPIYEGVSDFSEGLAGVHGGNLVVAK